MSEPAIDVGGLGYTYPGSPRPAVAGMDFSVPTSEIFGFLGPSGAGKTTTQQILIGLRTGWRGDVRLLGRDLRRWGRDLYDQIGVSFELPAGYAKLTVREDLAHFAMLHGPAPRDADELLAAVGLDDVSEAMVGTLSKGMRVRLNLARALLHRPRLLFLDEPTGGLDPATSRMIRDVIADERDSGVTIFLTTHDMLTADVLCDRVAFVIDGRIAACGRPRNLRLSAGSRQITVEYRANGELLSRQFPMGRADPALAELLASPTVETVHTTEASLDDVFIDITGRPL